MKCYMNPIMDRTICTVAQCHDTIPIDYRFKTNGEILLTHLIKQKNCKFILKDDEVGNMTAKWLRNKRFAHFVLISSHENTIKYKSLREQMENADTTLLI